MACLILLCGLWASAVADEETSKLFMIDGGSRPSYLFAGRPQAWLAHPRDLPAQLRQAVKRAKVLIFAQPFWDQEAIRARQRVPKGMSLLNDGSIIHRLSLPACEGYLRLLRPEESVAMERLRPGALLMILEQRFKDHLISLMDLSADDAVDDETKNEIKDLTRDLFGRAAEFEDLNDRALAWRQAGRGTRLPLDRALYAARDGGEVRALDQHEPFTNYHLRYDRLIGVEDVDDALVWFSQSLDAIDAAWVRRQRALELVPLAVNAEYLRARNPGVMHLLECDQRTCAPWRDRLRRYELGVQRYWQREILEVLAGGGAFVAVPIEYVLGHPGTGAPGLLKSLGEAGFTAHPLEVNDGAHLH